MKYSHKWDGGSLCITLTPETPEELTACDDAVGDLNKLDVRPFWSGYEPDSLEWPESLEYSFSLLFYTVDKERK